MPTVTGAYSDKNAPKPETRLSSKGNGRTLGERGEQPATQGGSKLPRK